VALKYCGVHLRTLGTPALFHPASQPQRVLSTGIQSFWVLCFVLVLSACTSSPIRTGTYYPTPSNSNNVEIPNTLSPEKAQGLAVYALGLVGTPYKWGGNTPDSGFDCSGLIAYVYQSQTGVKSPRTVAGLKSWGHEVSRQQLRTGDILLFGPSKEPSHAGIYVGEDRFVHAPSTGGTVRLNKLTTAYWKEKELSIRRP